MALNLHVCTLLCWIIAAKWITAASKTAYCEPATQIVVFLWISALQCLLKSFRRPFQWVNVSFSFFLLQGDKQCATESADRDSLLSPQHSQIK